MSVQPALPAYRVNAAAEGQRSIQKMTIRRPNEVDVLVSGVDHEANATTIAEAINSHGRMTSGQADEIAKTILSGQKTLISCESQLKAEELRTVLVQAGCRASIEN